MPSERQLILKDPACNRIGLTIAGNQLYAMRIHRKNVFWPNIFVGAAFQILDNQQVACGFRPTKGIRPGGKSRLAGKLGPAAILNQNPIFEMGSGKPAIGVGFGAGFLENLRQNR
jgi:hypothetical protein